MAVAAVAFLLLLSLQEVPSGHLVSKLQVPGNAGRAYGALSGDRNPIHLFPFTSQLFGFKRPIAHALFLVGCLEGALQGAGESWRSM